VIYVAGISFWLWLMDLSGLRAVERELGAHTKAE